MQRAQWSSIFLLDMNVVYLAVFADASFACDKDMSSQLEYVALLVDDNGIANVVHCASHKSRRVVRSELPVEHFALIKEFEVASTLSMR